MSSARAYLLLGAVAGIAVGVALLHDGATVLGWAVIAGATFFAAQAVFEDTL